jgi:16S rRNA (uracil1498-N3)-methyltransferase
LGVSAIQPIASQRSVVKLTAERAQKRLQHWQNVANAACEQSGRALVPQVFAPLSLAQWLSQAPLPKHKLMLSPQAEQSISQLNLASLDICLLIGAEGGFSEEEYQLATLSGFQAVRMGGRVLRTETAALTAIAALQTLYGDFSD